MGVRDWAELLSACSAHTKGLGLHAQTNIPTLCDTEDPAEGFAHARQVLPF